MKAMIFAAGLGTRLKPLTDTLPKALVPLAGKTLLQWQIEKLKLAGITDIVVNVHHFPDMIIDYLHKHNNFGCNIQVSDERDMLLETGGGLRKAMRLLSNKAIDEGILVCNVDILSNIDIPTLLKAYNPDEMGVVVVSERETQRYLLFNEENRLCGWTNIATGEVRGPIADCQSPIANRQKKVNLLLHDAARPFVSQDIIARVCEALEQHEAVTVAIPSTDTIYEMVDGKVARIPQRSTIMRAQTPQAFCLDLIAEAYAKALGVDSLSAEACAEAHLPATDDCGVVYEHMPQMPIHIVLGEEQNKKITFKEDI